MHPFLGMHEGLEHIVCLLTETGDAGSSPHVARCFFFNDVPWQNIAIYIIKYINYGSEIMIKYPSKYFKEYS